VTQSGHWQLRLFEDPVSVSYQSQLPSNHAKTYTEDDEVRKLSLSDWGSVAEIVATVAVVISLIFVVISLERNTAVMQASNDNFIYELQYGRVRDIVSSPGMASIYVKHRNGEDLSAEEKERFYWDKMQELSTWELAFNRHRDGLFSTKLWEGWNEYFIVSFKPQFSADAWAKVRDFYAEDFQSHVDAVYAEQ